jgi:TPR repeat protein
VSKTISKISALLLCGIVSGLLAMGAWAQPQKGFPGAPIDQRTMRTQVRVDELYESGEYDRALLIYQRELAPIGDKYAQYMVGYMHQAGQGVPASRPAALAWYRLAAERGEPSILQARDQLYQGMNAAEIEESTGIFADIWQQYGDNSLLFDLIRDDMELLRQQTGTRVPGAGRALTVINMRSGQGSSAVFYDRVEKRIELRLGYLETSVEITDVALAEDAADIYSIEEELRKEFAALQSP